MQQTNWQTICQSYLIWHSQTLLSIDIWHNNISMHWGSAERKIYFSWGVKNIFSHGAKIYFLLMAKYIFSKWQNISSHGSKAYLLMVANNIFSKYQNISSHVAKYIFSKCQNISSHGGKRCFAVGASRRGESECRQRDWPEWQFASSCNFFMSDIK